MSTRVTCPDCYATVREIGDERFGGEIHELCQACMMERMNRFATSVKPVGGLSCTVDDENKMTPRGSGSQNEETRKMASGARCGRVVRKPETMS